MTMQGNEQENRKKARRTYTSVSEMLADLAPDQDIQKEYAEHSAARAVISHLMALRAIKGMTQQDIADHMRCTQGRVSKLENSFDADLRLGDVDDYAAALGCAVGITITPKRQNCMDRIKYHAFQIADELEHMTTLAETDDAMVEGVAHAHLETLVNMVRLVAESASTLPCRSETQRPYLRIDIRSAELLDDPDPCETDTARNFALR